MPQLLLGGVVAKEHQRLCEVVARGGCYEVVTFVLKRRNKGLKPPLGGDVVGLVEFVEVDERSLTRKVIGDGGQCVEKPLYVVDAEREESVATTTYVRDDVGDRLVKAQEFGCGVEGDVHILRGVVTVDDATGEGLWPHKTTTERVALRDEEAVVLRGEGDGRHSVVMHPHLAERAEVGIGVAVENLYQLGPGGVTVGEGGEVVADALLVGIVTHNLHKFVHHDGGFVVDDASVDESRILQIVKLLAYRRRACGAVFGKGCYGVTLKTAQAVVDGGVEGLYDACCEVVGEDLLGPHIVKPAHSDIVAKPHMCSLVGDDRRAAETLIEGRVVAEEHLRGVVERSTRMLHTAILEAWQHYEVVLGKGVFDACVLLQPLERILNLAEHIVELCDALGVGLAVVCRKAVSAIVIGLVVEDSCNEGEEVCGEWLGGCKLHNLVAVIARVACCNGGVGYCAPRLGKCQREGVRRLEVGLVEAGKEGASTVGHKECVEVLLVAV